MSDFKILIVEDEATTGMVLQFYLKQEGFIVTELVTTGEKSIESARTNTPDLILMDIQLAGKIDGIEAVKAIQSSINVPVIFITAYDDIEIRKNAMSLNPVAFFNKPYSNKQLINKINEIKNTISKKP